MIRKVLHLIFVAFALGFFSLAAFVGYGWWTYHRLEKSVVERMDQYYLTVTSPGREEYLLQSDEVFEVPYMASKLSVSAVPTRIFDAKDRLMGEFSTEKGVYVGDPGELPLFLKEALVASEDGTFYKHHGVNWRAVARALYMDLKSMRRVQGGSTITQQLAKMMFTTRKKTLGRKIFELFCARKIESKFTKDQILLMYLNFAYYGHGCFGVAEASRYYFGKSAGELELPEAAMLVGIIANPNKYSPYENLELAKARHRTVLNRMAKLGFIPATAVGRYSSEFWETMAGRSAIPQVSFWKMRSNLAPYPVEFLRRNLLGRFTKERIMKGGLTIRTTFDLDFQKAAETALQSGLREENKISRDGGKNTGPLIEGSLVALSPQDGAMLAMVGGSGFNFSNQLNRAADSRRLIGSAVKPFIYAVAFESGGFKPEDQIVDEPIRYRIGGGRHWSPHNFGNKYYGKVTLSFALHESLNSVAIQLLHSIDIDEVIRVLSEASGIAPSVFPRNLSLALGTVDFSALELARSYAIFANGGRAVEPYYIRTIEDRDGKVVQDERGRHGPGVSVLKPETCATMIDVMKGVLGPEGTAHSAAVRTGFNIPAAGKTGTTNENRDAWFAGLTPELSAAVWMGHDDQRISLGKGMVGGSICAPAWMNFVKAVYRNRPAREFDGPGLKK